MKIAIYGRVSTDEQETENQLRQLRAWCKTEGHTVVKEYIENESGRKGTGGRKAFSTLLDDTHKFDCVLFWSLDRFSREGMIPTIMHLQRLADAGVAFKSLTEPHLSTENELVRNILLALLASLAKIEVQKISARTKAGLDRARANGAILGRPPINPEKAKAIRKTAQTQSFRATARLHKVGVATVSRLMA